MKRTIRAWSGLTQLKVTPDMLRFNQTLNAVKNLRRQVQKEKHDLLISEYEEIFRLEVSHLLLDNGTLFIYIHVPTVKIDTTTTLYEYVNLPYILHNTNQTNDLAMFADPRERYISVSPDNRKFKTFTEAEIAKCRIVGQTYFCAQNIYDRRRGHSCLMALFLRDIADIKKLCSWKFALPHDFSLQVSPDEFLLYQVHPTEVRLVCDQESASEFPQGLMKITVPPNCQLYSESFIFEGQARFAVLVDSYIPREINVSLLIQELGLPRNHSETLEALQKLDLINNPDGIKVSNIKDRLAHQ